MAAGMRTRPSESLRKRGDTRDQHRECEIQALVHYTLPQLLCPILCRIGGASRSLRTTTPSWRLARAGGRPTCTPKASQPSHRANGGPRGGTKHLRFA